MLTALFLALLLPCAAAQAPREPLSAPVPAERQIQWQRSLEDALALAAAEQRPILIAVNMDGESASENIVRERYRDPRFVALTRRFVCLGASAFRHGERDHAYDGRRLLSPRLGAITSGEAMALEPILFDQYLGTERVAPRHALILQGGAKHFDLYRLFDLRDLDRALAEAQALAPEPAVRDESPLDGGALAPADWLRLAAAKDNRGRERFEALLAKPAPLGNVFSAVAAIGHAGDAGSVEALRLALARCDEAPGVIVPQCVDAARARGFDAALAAVVREMLMDVPEDPMASGAPGLGARAELLDALALLAGDSGANRSLLVSFAVAGSGADERARAFEALEGDDTLAAAIEEGGGPVDPARILAHAAQLPREAPWRADDALPAGETVEAELVAADAALTADAGDPEAELRFGRAALTAARSRMQANGAAIDLLLTDAQAALERATRAAPAGLEGWLLLARTAYLRSDFETEELAALGALAATPPLARESEDLLLGRRDGTQEELAAAARELAAHPGRSEALRWVADAAARRVAGRSGGDLATEAAGLARGFCAATLAALAPNSTPTDWLTLSALYAALGRRAEEIATAELGLEFFPDDQALRGAFYRGLWDRGYASEARRRSEALAERHPGSAAARWYVGYAAMREGDTLRRAEDPRAAIRAYTLADLAFQASVRAEPGYQDSADFYRALAALGSGFAHLLLDGRVAAAEALVAGIRIRPSIADVRDSLDREAVDLLDGALEWRLSGPSPVDPLELARALLAADSESGRWARSLSDSELREGLRADGRKDPSLGDRYLASAIAIARLAQGSSAGDAERRALAQALAVDAERRILRADFEAARPRLAEAAGLLGTSAPPSGGSDGEWVELAARLREKLGEARPVFRPGR